MFSDMLAQTTLIATDVTAASRLASDSSWAGLAAANTPIFRSVVDTSSVASATAAAAGFAAIAPSFEVTAFAETQARVFGSITDVRMFSASRIRGVVATAPRALPALPALTITAARPSSKPPLSQSARDDLAPSLDGRLLALAPDLVRKRRGMWFAVEHSPDGRPQAASSAIELGHRTLRLLAPDDLVDSWADTPERRVACYPRKNRPSWGGRARFVVAIAGADDMTQDLASSLASETFHELELVKHRDHDDTGVDVRDLLVAVEQLLDMLFL